MKRLNLGCGTDYRKEWINLDFNKKFKADVYFDLGKIYEGKKLPFKDKIFDRIVLRHVLEHFAEPLPLLRELYRICNVNGVIEIEVPYGHTVYYNLDHRHQFFLGSFNVLNFDDYCAGGDLQIEVVEKRLYIHPTKSIIKKLFYPIFLKTINFFIKKGKDSLYDQTILKNLFQNTNIFVKYKRVK